MSHDFQPGIFTRLTDLRLSLTWLHANAQEVGLLMFSLRETGAITAVTSLCISGQYGPSETITLAHSLAQATSLRSLTLTGESPPQEAGRRRPLGHYTLPQSTAWDRLRLASTGVARLTGPLTYLPQLTFLDLSDQDIGALGATMIANSLCHLTLLGTLNLGNNNMGDSGLIPIARSLPISVTSLDITCNNVRGAGASTLFTRMNVLGISSLILRFNPLGSPHTPPTLASFPSRSAHGQFLTSLDLSSMNIDNAGATHLSFQLRTVPLRILRMGHNVLRAAGMRRMGAILSSCLTMTTFDLQSNQYGGEGLDVWGTWLNHPHTSLTELNLRTAARHSPSITATGGFLEALAQLASLQRLELRDNLWGPECEPFLQTLHHHTSLLQLNLGGNHPQYEHVVALLATVTQLTLLDLRFCALSLHSMPTLERLLTAGPSLLTLNLDGNQLGRTGIQALLRTNHSRLTQLSLAHNCCPGAGVWDMTTPWGCRSLTCLDISYATLSAQGTIWTAHHCMLLPSLRHLSLDGNDVGDEGAQALLTLAKLSRLTQLDLVSNRVSPRWQRALLASPPCFVLGLLRTSTRHGGTPSSALPSNI